MKRVLSRAGITLVGMAAWLLPNQAKADGWHNCHAAVNGIPFMWSCASQNDCRMNVRVTGNTIYVTTYCA